MRRSVLLLLALLTLVSPATAQDFPSLRLLEEGTSLGLVNELNCVGTTVTCTRANNRGTLTISGATGAPADAQYLTLATNGTLTVERVLTAGTGIGFTDGGAGSTLTVANTGVLSITGTANQVAASAATGAVTLALPSAVTLPGSLTVTTRTGTPATMAVFTSGGVLAETTLPSAGAPADAQYLTLATNGTLTVERVLTGTANQVVLTDNGAGSTLVMSLPQSIHTAATPTFATLTLTGSATIGSTAAAGLTITPGTTGLPLTAAATGSDAHVGIKLVPKGFGSEHAGDEPVGVHIPVTLTGSTANKYPQGLRVEVASSVSANVNPYGGHFGVNHTGTGNIDTGYGLTSTFFLNNASSTAALGYGHDAELGVQAGTVTDGYGLYANVFSLGGTITRAHGVYGRISNEGSATIASGYAVYAASPNNSGGGAITTAYGVYIGNQIVTGGTTDYAIWYDGTGANSGVWRLKSDGVVAYYNPSFAAYTPDATNHERIVTQWTSNVGEIGTEAGGTGTQRALRLLGASYFLSGLTSNGFIKTTGGNGALSIDTSTYLTASTGVSSITGTANQVIASASVGAVTLSLPQSIATSSSPQFSSLGLGTAAGAAGTLTTTGVVLGPDGSVSAPAYAFSSDTGMGLYRIGVGVAGIATQGGLRAYFGSQVQIGQSLGFGANPTTSDVVLTRDGAANVLALRNSTTAQTYRVYNTWTDASNGEWFETVWGAAANHVGLRTNKNGTGSSRVANLYFSGGTVPALQWGVINSDQVEIGVGNSNNTVFSAAGYVRMLTSRSLTATSGVDAGVGIGGTWAPTATSTMTAIGLNIKPTINYSNATPGAGSYEALKIAVTETALPTGTNYLIRASAGAGGSTDKFVVSNAGDWQMAGNNTDYLRVGSGAGDANVRIAIGGAVANRVILGSSTELVWSSSFQAAAATLNTNADLKLARDAANTLAQRNSTTAQVSRLYNTWTDASNGEWLETAWSSNVLTMGTKGNGSGSTSRSLQLSYAGSSSAAIFFGTATGAIQLGRGTGSTGTGAVVDIGNAATTAYTATSGTRVGLDVTHGAAPTGTSTMAYSALRVRPTINYSNGTPGAGSYEALTIAVTETALPTGQSYLIRALAGVAGTTDLFSVTNAGLTNAVGGYTHGANAGASATVSVRKGDDSGACNLVFSGGLYISTTC